MLRSEIHSVQSEISPNERMFCEPRGQSPVMTSTTAPVYLDSPVLSAFHMSMPFLPPPATSGARCVGTEKGTFIYCVEEECVTMLARRPCPGFAVRGRRLPVSTFPCRAIRNCAHVTLHLWASGLLFLSEMERSKTSSSCLTDL